MSSSQSMRFSLFENRASSTLSTKSSTGSTINSTKEEQQYAEYLHKLRMQQYNNVVKTEATFNSGVLGSINTLQDSEMNELLKNIDSLMASTVDSIDRNDPVIAVLNQEGQGQEANPVSSRVEWKANSEPSVLLAGLVQTDLLRNGLKSGPLPHQKDSVETVETVKNPKLSKPNPDLIPTLNSHLNYKQLMGTKNRVILKYLFVLDLNPKYFELIQMNKVQPLYSVKMARRPLTWSNIDVDQFTIEIKANPGGPAGHTGRPSLNKANTQSQLQLPTLSKFNGSQSYREPATAAKAKPMPLSSFSNSNYVPGKRTSRYLNSRSIFDRVYRHFVRVLNFEWVPPVDQKNSGQEQKSFDVDRRCELSGNQLKIFLKWKVSGFLFLFSHITQVTDK
jgi:hypothetical protein